MQEARGLAERFLASLPMELVILDEHTMETEFGWVFFWTSKKYRETGNFEYAVAGNTPLIVDRREGSVHETSTAEPIEEIIERYRKDHVVVP
jgi:hypothetical protein